MNEPGPTPDIRSRFVPKGAAVFPLDAVPDAMDIHFALLPGLTLLALSSAIEPLRIANQLTQRELYRWHTLSAEGRAIICSNGMAITPDGPLVSVPRGGRVFVCSGVDPVANLETDVTRWVARQRAFGVRIGALCTGAFTLAEAGAIRGRRFTLHWENQPAFVERFLNLSPSPNLFEIDGPLVTAAGGSAAIDMMLALLEADLGPDLARTVSDMCLHGRSGSGIQDQRSSLSVALGSRNSRLIEAAKLMQTHIEDALSLDEIADAVSISRRQLERAFKAKTGKSPAQFYTDLRIERGYALLSETDMSTQEAAAATGFGSIATFSAHFRARFGASPHGLRRKWARVR